MNDAFLAGFRSEMDKIAKKKEESSRIIPKLLLGGSAIGAASLPVGAALSAAGSDLASKATRKEIASTLKNPSGTVSRTGLTAARGSLEGGRGMKYVSILDMMNLRNPKWNPLDPKTAPSGPSAKAFLDETIQNTKRILARQNMEDVSKTVKDRAALEKLPKEMPADVRAAKVKELGERIRIREERIKARTIENAIRGNPQNVEGLRQDLLSVSKQEALKADKAAIQAEKDIASQVTKRQTWRKANPRKARFGPEFAKTLKGMVKSKPAWLIPAAGLAGAAGMFWPKGDKTKEQPQKAK